MALSADTPRQYDPAYPPMFADLPVEASDTVYEGAAVTDSGSAGLVDGALIAAEAFLGFAEEHAADTSGVSSTIRVKVRQQGVIKNLPVTGLDADTDLGAAVYATDNGTFTLTSSAAYVQIGKVQSWNDVADYGDVFFQAATVRSV